MAAPTVPVVEVPPLLVLVAEAAVAPAVVLEVAVAPLVLVRPPVELVAPVLVRRVVVLPVVCPVEPVEPEPEVLPRVETVSPHAHKPAITATAVSQPVALRMRRNSRSGHPRKAPIMLRFRTRKHLPRRPLGGQAAPGQLG